MVFLCWGISMMIFGQEISMAAWSAASTSEGKRVVQILGQVGGGKWPNVIPPWKLTCPPTKGPFEVENILSTSIFPGDVLVSSHQEVCKTFPKMNHDESLPKPIISTDDEGCQPFDF